ncbi:MAG TPA: peptidoglycan recognition family protein [Verrucomicrobiae bacterium]
MKPFYLLGLGALLGILAAGCSSFPPGHPAARSGDEIVVAGQFFHTGTPVVLWLDPGGYDAYRVERRFAPLAESSWTDSQAKNPNLHNPNRYSLRRHGLTTNELERVRGGGWDLPLLQQMVDQFVLHFDVCGTSRTCFQVLQDDRGLSVHFMLDLDGTIYQTLDLKERAAHATIANDRSIGVEIANIGAYPVAGKNPLAQWYATNANGRVTITLPRNVPPDVLRTPGFIGHPARNELIQGPIQGEDLVQYDYTDEQYNALIHLTAALCRIFPKLPCDYPHDANGAVIPGKLPEAELEKYRGVLGHYHIQRNKDDPGPAMNWPRLIHGARQLLGTEETALLTPRACQNITGQTSVSERGKY